jgi:urease accessory protein
MRLTLIRIVLTGALVSPAFAHTGVGPTNSFASGVAHPLGGADHILAMLAVGLWGVLAGGRATWAWPAAFVATMLGGFAAATLGLQMPFVEPAISSSVIVLGLFVALAAKAPVWLGAAIVGLFAFFHGHAHGTEATATTLIPYAAGFTLATAGLLAAGIGLGGSSERAMGKLALRAMGGLTMLGGVAFLAG